MSTRGEAPALGFLDVVLAALAPDGGLYLPERWPVIEPARIRAFAAMRFEDVATDVVGRFADGELAAPVLAPMIAEAMATFRHAARTPVAQLAPNQFLLELFHGPTLAFKDVAMQVIARLIDHVLAERGQRATIVAATSGDTGAAAAEAFAGRDRVDLVVLFPRGKVSPVQQRQMTTIEADNVHALAIEGTFDDCQRIVKTLFLDRAFREEVALTGVNSINWARIVVQAVYYFAAAAALGAPERRVAFTVPTGNFGDIFAGWVARRMGLPVDRLVIATNQNDILARFLATGRYEPRTVHATRSPSMDIQVASNFERLLFEASGRDPALVRDRMAALAGGGAFELRGEPMDRIRRDFAAVAVDETETIATMARTYQESERVVDPHTAVGLAAAARVGTDPEVPMVTLATAHPAKFPDAVEEACGLRPALPERLAGMMTRRERVTALPADARCIAETIRRVSRAARIGAPA